MVYGWRGKENHFAFLCWWRAEVQLSEPLEKPEAGFSEQFNPHHLWNKLPIHKHGVIWNFFLQVIFSGTVIFVQHQILQDLLIYWNERIHKWGESYSLVLSLNQRRIPGYFPLSLSVSGLHTGIGIAILPLLNPPVSCKPINYKCRQNRVVLQMHWSGQTWAGNVMFCN